MEKRVSREPQEEKKDKIWDEEEINTENRRESLENRKKRKDANGNAWRRGRRRNS